MSSINEFVKHFQSKKNLLEREGFNIEKIHKELLPEGRQLVINHRSAKKSAVLLNIFEKEEKLFFIVIKRKSDLSVHSGQIALPGGRFDKKLDKTLLDTAIRETYEEIGINKYNIQVFGELNDVYIPPSNFIVTPFVAFLKELPDYKINRDEIENVYELSLNTLFKEGIVKQTYFDTIYGKVYAPYFDFDEVKIWGATALILNEFRYIAISN